MCEGWRNIDKVLNFNTKITSKSVSLNLTGNVARTILQKTAEDRMSQRIDFQKQASDWKHWRLEVDGEVANLFMDVDETAGLFDGYELKLNSLQI